MPRPRRWSDLLPGLLAIALLAGGVAAVLLFARVGTVHGAKFRLFATVQEARGLSSGSEVWVAGKRVGVVDAIDYLPPSSDTAQRLLLTLHVLENVRSVIRRGADVGVHPGGNLIGAPVVTIALGDARQPPVSPDDTLRSPPETDMDRARSDFQDATGELPLILTNVKLLDAQLRATRGTLGAFGIDGASTMTRAMGTASGFMTRVRSSRGPVGRLMARDGASHYAREALARADSVRQLIAAPPSQQSLGRFRRDSTLLGAVAAVRAELDTVATVLARSEGTAGRLQHDQALTQSVTQTRAELAALIADLKRHPLRYLAF
ncbi:Mammalian cell entry related domain protein [Gemmatirosa kalamazoonensis]|uniref:Mammalian cell entry related domain protein n=1 Tax=Gemmatirosa kalamazoonensis TaxID=861299 RepID=W0RIJ3_9BACT|nr:MlaD family protein [Gemmatirosa kalamazoonensis]AHG90160.1 Mammalian cell entry related domain protein [Gemmatirosa kalamazoonensis]